jgi:hypothetical protein
MSQLGFGDDKLCPQRRDLRILVIGYGGRLGHG